MEHKKHDLLVIEDDKVDQVAFQRLIKEMNSPFNCTIAGSVGEAKAILASEKFDVILADYLLGDGTAFDIFDLDIETPIIVITGSGDEEVAVKAMRSGAYDYLIKDPDRNYLKVIPTAIERVISLKNAEVAFRESEERYRTLTENVNVGVYRNTVGPKGKFIEANPALVRMFGYDSREELFAVNVANLYQNPEDREKFSEKLLTESFVRNEEKQLKKKDGTPLIASVSAVAVEDESGEVEFFDGVIEDITNRKKAEEERERLLNELGAKNRELEQFSYTVSHDLSSPLFAIQGFANLLREDLEQGDKEKMEFELEHIENAAIKMDCLLNDTLQLSRIGRVANPSEDVPFGEMVEEALEQTVEHIKTSGVEVCVAEDFPSVHVDRIRIVEVLVNLITNSIRYMGEQPSPRIEIGYRVEGEETVFFVQDNGMGIAESEHEKVFDLFYKLDRSSKGTGAGLAIVKRIIEVHEGRIWIESEKGKGCTICFTLSVQ